MPDTIHVDSCPHTAVDNALVIRMVCARSDGVLSGSWVHVPRPPRFHTRVSQPFRSRLLSRSVPIFRTNLWRYARRITMAVAIAAPPPIWCIPTPSDNAQCFVLILKDSSGDLVYLGYFAYFLYMNFVPVMPNLCMAAVHHYSGYILNYKSVYHSGIFHNRMLVKLFYFL